MKERIRLCIGCYKLYNVERLIKIKLSDGKLYINPKFYLTGRSSYLCYNSECASNVKKYKKLEKSFKSKTVKFSDDIWVLLGTEISNRSDLKLEGKNI